MDDIKDKYIEDQMKRRSDKRNTGIFWFIAGILIALAITSLDARAQLESRLINPLTDRPLFEKTEQRSSTADFYERQERERKERRDRYNEEAPEILRQFGDVTLIEKGYKQKTCWNLGGTLICE